MPPLSSIPILPLPPSLPPSNRPTTNTTKTNGGISNGVGDNNGYDNGYYDNDNDGQDDNDNNNNDVVDTRPSALRRKQLNEELLIPTVSNFFPIDRYYDTAQIAYETVMKMFNDNSSTITTNNNTLHHTILDEIYLYGKRYSYFVIDAIPTHNYYNSPNNIRNKQKHTKQVMNIILIIEKIIELMDVEETIRAKLLKEQQERLKKEEEERMLQQFNDLQNRISNLKNNNNNTNNNNNVEQSALSKLALLSPMKPPKEDPPNGSSSSSNSKRKTTTRYGLHVDSEDDDDDNNNNGKGNLPPPMLPPNHPSSIQPPLPPPSYDSAITTTPSSSSSIRKKKNVTIQEKTVPTRTLQLEYKAKYYEYQKLGKIVVHPLDTYQGRTYDSTNGCTVISALVAATHLQNKNNQNLDNSIICNIIDNKCGPILKQIRNKLGLNGAALIIPSDVHDYLVDCNIFKQEQFVGVAGGNILDRAHYGEFLRLLACGNNKTPHHNKSSATLFYHEHVISIIKVPIIGNNNNSCYYDLIDSLPTYQGNRATRTRCNDIQSLEILLQYYTTNKLTNQNCNNIDHTKWDDNTADIDPRVFQGFIWMNPKQ